MDIRDIARISGYSLGTVSRAINGKPNVSDKARARILAVIEENGYEPNQNARNLKQSSQEAIGVLVKGAHNQLFAEVVEHVQAGLMAAGESMQTIYLDEDSDEVAEAVRYQRELHFKGVIFLGGDPANFRAGFSAIDVPSVLLTNSAERLGFQNLSSFTTDDVSAAGELVDELYAAGHRHIGVVGGNGRAEQIGTLRMEGAALSLMRHGLSFDAAEDHERSRFSMSAGYEATLRLLRRRPTITAVLAVGDVIAIGAMRALFDLGRRVPEGFSVVGFDGLEVSQYISPRLTTVCQDMAALAGRGVACLLDHIADPALPPVFGTVPHVLYRGESVGRPPRNLFDLEGE